MPVRFIKLVLFVQKHTQTHAQRGQKVFHDIVVISLRIGFAKLSTF